MDKNQARLFAERFASGKYTEAEHQAFFQWLSGLPLAESRILLEEYSAMFEALPDAPASRQLWDKIAPRLDEPAEPVIRKTRLFYLGRVGAAAAVIGIIGVAVWLMVRRPPAITAQTADVAAPASNRAMITLDNGRQVDLDSARNGMLALQGSTKVVKLADGRLTYTAGSRTGSAMLYNTLSNPRGSRVVNLTLSDGTGVWLNAESSIRYPVTFGDQKRVVEVTGEAYLEVAQDADKAFSVKQGKTSIDVLGTAFDVNAYGDESPLEVTVLDGKVRLEKLILLAGEQAKAGDSVRRSGTVDTAAVMAWKNGRFAFHGASLVTVMRQLARWYNVEVVYEGAIPDQHFSGRLGRSLNLEQVLKILAGTGVNYRIEGGPQSKLIIRQATP